MNMITGVSIARTPLRLKDSNKIRSREIYLRIVDGDDAGGEDDDGGEGSTISLASMSGGGTSMRKSLLRMHPLILRLSCKVQ